MNFPEGQRYPPSAFGQGSSENDLRLRDKWFAQLAKWFAPHFENNGHPWENGLRVDLRLVCARGPEVPVAQRKPFSSDPAMEGIQSITALRLERLAEAPLWALLCSPLWRVIGARNASI